MRNSIIKLFQPKYQYIFIPLTFVVGCVIAALHYCIRKDIKKTIQTLLIGFVVSAIFYLFIPLVIQEYFNGPDILGLKYSIIYFYLVSISTSIYFIREQERYLNRL